MTYLSCTVEYRLISKKGEGTFSEVLKAQSIKTGKYVAIKCMKSHFDSIEQVSLKTAVMNHHFHHFLAAIGEQPTRDLGAEAIVAPPTDYQTV